MRCPIVVELVVRTTERNMMLNTSKASKLRLDLILWLLPDRFGSVVWLGKLNLVWYV